MYKVLNNYFLNLPSVLMGASLLILASGANASEVNKVDEVATHQIAKVESTTPKASTSSAINSNSTNQTQIAATPVEVSSTASTTSVVPTANLTVPATDSSSLQYLDQINRYGNEGTGNQKTAQNVTSVSQLSDVRPTDWAFTALQSLVERYGCIAGYPDRTYRGQRAMTRYEFAAGLNACLDKINELISSGLADKVSKADLAALQKLQEEFAAELAALRGRVDALEAKTARLEAQQFSTTTKLQGVAFFNLTGATADNIRFEPGVRGANGRPVVNTTTKPNTTLSGLVWLTLNTSFTGKDLLLTTLAAGNGFSPANTLISAGQFNQTGTPFTDQTSGTSANQFILRELYYQFPIFDNKASLVFGPRINYFRFFDANRFTFFLNGTTGFNHIDSTLTNPIKRGAGAVFLLPIGNQFEFNAGYLAESNEFLSSNSASNPNEGLFGGDNNIVAELIFKPSKDINLRFGYNRANIKARNGLISGQPILGVADDGFGGILNNAQADVFSFNFDWLVTRGFGLFGRYGYATTNLNAANPARTGSIVTQAFQVGFALPDLFKEGAQGTVSFVMPFNYTSGRNYLIAGAGDGSTQYEVEGTYYFPITKNIAIVPNVTYVWNANNFSGQSIFVGNIRTQFTF